MNELGSGPISAVQCVRHYGYSKAVYEQTTIFLLNLITEDFINLICTLFFFLGPQDTAFFLSDKRRQRGVSLNHIQVL